MSEGGQGRKMNTEVGGGRGRAGDKKDDDHKRHLKKLYRNLHMSPTDTHIHI